MQLTFLSSQPTRNTVRTQIKHGRCFSACTFRMRDIGSCDSKLQSPRLTVSFMFLQHETFAQTTLRPDSHWGVEVTRFCIQQVCMTPTEFFCNPHLQVHFSMSLKFADWQGSLHFTKERWPGPQTFLFPCGLMSRYNEYLSWKLHTPSCLVCESPYHAA